MTNAPTLAQIRRALARHRPRKSTETFRPAAVLVPLLPRPEGLHVLFTERSHELRAHAGQISFPGGGIDSSDADARAAALREAQEEVGLDPRHVEIIGQLDDCPTFVTGYVILPVVGVVDSLAFTAAKQLNRLLLIERLVRPRQERELAEGALWLECLEHLGQPRHNAVGAARVELPAREPVGAAVENGEQ